jgi:hypothetical protein
MVRPIKTAREGALVQLSVKLPGGTKNRLDAAARASGVSQGREMSQRLAWSFEFEDRAGGRQAMDVVMLLAGAAKLKFGDRWADDPECYPAVDALWSELLAAIRPPLPKERDEHAELLEKMEPRARAKHEKIAQQMKRHWLKQMSTDPQRLQGLLDSGLDRRLARATAGILVEVIDSARADAAASEPDAAVRAVAETIPKLIDPGAAEPDAAVQAGAEIIVRAIDLARAGTATCEPDAIVGTVAEIIVKAIDLARGAAVWTTLREDTTPPRPTGEAAFIELLAAPIPLTQNRRDMVDLPGWLLVSLRAVTASRLGMPPALYRPFRRQFFKYIDQLGEVESADEQQKIHFQIDQLFGDLARAVAAANAARPAPHRRSKVM